MFDNKKEVSKIIENFINYLVCIKNYSINTAKAYLSDLILFSSFIKKYKNIPLEIKDFNIFVFLQIKESDIIAFLVYSNYSKNNCPYTRQRRVTSIKAFYKYILGLHPVINKINPTENLPQIKKDERLPKYLKLKQAKQIQTVFSKENTKFPERNNAIITLFLSTGIRLSELINIDINDINFDDNSITIFGKNSKERIVYFSSYCKEKLFEYLNTRVENDNRALFINRWGKRVGVNAVENICERAYKLLGINNNGYTVHTLRHTSASIMYIYVANDVLLVKEFLGHASLASTQIYTHLNNNKLREAVDKNPLNNYEKKRGK